MKKLIPVFVILAIGGIIAYLTIFKGESLDKYIISKCKDDKHIDEIEFAEIAGFMRSQEKFSNLSDKEVYDFLRNHKLVTNNGVTLASIEKEPPALVEGINFFIETSGSMKGFLGCPGVFTNVANQLAVTLEGIYRSINWHPKTIAENITVYNNRSEFSRLLTTGRLQCQGHSPLHKIFKQINDSTGINDINVFITDAILSGTDQEIRESTNQEFNRIQIVGLQDEITRAFRGANIPSEYGVIIYAFCSSFCGAPYFDYKNDNKPFATPINRPFYVFLIGKTSLLADADFKLKEKSELFDPLNELRLGFNSKTIQSYSLCNGMNLSKDCIVLPDYVRVRKIQDIDASNPIEFAVALNLSELPEYARNLDFLNKYIKVDTQQNLTDMSIEVFNRNSFLDQIEKPAHRSNMEKKLLGWKATHLILIKANGMVNYPTMKVILPKIVDNWYVEWTTEDDRNNYNSCDSTFGLKYLVNGIRNELEGNTENFLEVEFDIRRK